MQEIRPSAVRYIKLGSEGAWLDRCLAEDLLQFSDTVVPHDVARAGDWKEAERLYREQGKSLAKARRPANTEVGLTVPLAMLPQHEVLVDRGLAA